MVNLAEIRKRGCGRPLHLTFSYDVDESKVEKRSSKENTSSVPFKKKEKRPLSCTAAPVRGLRTIYLSNFKDTK